MINKCKPLSAQTLILRHQNCFLWSNATSSVKLFSRIPLTLPVFPDCWLRIKRKWKKSAMLDRVRRQRTLVLPVLPSVCLCWFLQTRPSPTEPLQRNVTVVRTVGRRREKKAGFFFSFFHPLFSIKSPEFFSR